MDALDARDGGGRLSPAWAWMMLDMGVARRRWAAVADKAGEGGGVDGGDEMTGSCSWLDRAAGNWAGRSGQGRAQDRADGWIDLGSLAVAVSPSTAAARDGWTLEVDRAGHGERVQICLLARLLWADGEDAAGRGERTVCGRTLLDLMREAADELRWIGWVDSHGKGGGGRCCDGLRTLLSPASSLVSPAWA
ncbi:hypothetical protein ACLOJK_040677 [Asimina triloba]